MLYTPLKTIQEVIIDRKCLRWKVTDEDGSMLKLFQGTATASPNDVATTLEKFLLPLKGDYVRIFVYDPKFKGSAGGDTKATVYRYYYALNSTPNKETAPANSIGVTGFGLAEILNLHSKVNELQTQLALQSKDAEIRELKKESGTGKKYSYLESMAEHFAKTFAKEIQKKEMGISDEDETQPVNGAKKKAETPAPKKPGKKKAPEATQKDFAKRSGDAVKRLAKVGGYTVANGLEELADLAETNPAKLAEIISQLETE